MTKTEFKSFLSYLKTHPSDAESLKALLDESESVTDLASKEGNAEWLTAKEVGERLHQSGKWVRERLQDLPPDSYERRGNRGTWYIDYPKVKNLLMDMRQ